MSLSEDDDFLSADEDGFYDDKNIVCSAGENLKPDTRATGQIKLSKHSETESRVDTRNEKAREPHDAEIRALVENDEVKKSHKQKITDLERNDAEKVMAKHDHNDNDDGDQDEKALAERVRERNLKIARKFSVEIAKNLMASAPIPVKSPLAPIGFKIDNDNILDCENASSLPPAPPPTPARTSSFNSEDPISSDPNLQSGWRVPSTKSKIPGALTSGQDKSEQARQALDRLSVEDNRSLFEKARDDVMKLSIKSGDPVPSESQGTAGGSNETKAPLVSPEVVRNLVGFTNFFSSFVDIFEEKSSKLQEESRVQDADQGQSKQLKDIPPASDEQLSGKDERVPVNTAGESSSNDALVDFTLNAMESLGKKAFDVMTRRDESGSLQIRGFGRPWEPLLNLRKPQEAPPHQQNFPADNELPKIDAISADKKIDDKPTSLKNRKRRSDYDEGDDQLD